MQRLVKSFLAAAVLLVSVGMFAQENYASGGHDFLVRLSYDRSTMPHADIDELQRVCVSVSRDGDYRFVRIAGAANGYEPQRLHGKLTKAQFNELKALLGSEEFNALSGNYGGLIRQDAETFMAEISKPTMNGEDENRRLQWLNADGERPFPGSVAKVVDWLKHFEPKDGKPFEYARYKDVCPSSGLRLVQPAVAANEHP
jgi:hypothetical protein